MKEILRHAFQLACMNYHKAENSKTVNNAIYINAFEKESFLQVFKLEYS